MPNKPFELANGETLAAPFPIAMPGVIQELVYLDPTTAVMERVQDVLPLPGGDALFAVVTEQRRAVCVTALGIEGGCPALGRRLVYRVARTPSKVWLNLYYDLKRGFFVGDPYENMEMAYADRLRGGRYLATIQVPNGADPLQGRGFGDIAQDCYTLHPFVQVGIAIASEEGAR